MFLLCLIWLNVPIAVRNLNFFFLLLTSPSPSHCSTNNRHHLGNLGWWGCNLSFLTHILAWNEAGENVRYLKLFFKGDGMFQPCMAFRPNSLVCLWRQERHTSQTPVSLSLSFSVITIMPCVSMCETSLLTHAGRLSS